MTVKELRAKLDQLEKDYEPLAEQMGPFDLVNILVDVYNKSGQYCGVDKVNTVIPDYTLGILLLSEYDR